MNLQKLFVDVFSPEKDERILVITDFPHHENKDNQEWKDRRKMAEEWRAEFASLSKEIGFQVLPFFSYPATGRNNGDLPLDYDNEEGHRFRDLLSSATLTVALTEYSPSAPLATLSKELPDFRVTTLPGVNRRMLSTALAADYLEVARRCQVLDNYLSSAISADVVFSTKHTWHVDLRYRKTIMDDGRLPRGKKGMRLINLPSGETFKVPYEGERPGERSLTAGQIPVTNGSEIMVFHVQENRITEVSGPQNLAAEWTRYFLEDRARANIAEFAFGCNPMAVVSGNTLEDEKAGFHFAYGRSDHLGGTVGSSSFLSPQSVIHRDIVYAKDSPISVANLLLNDESGRSHLIIKNGEYTVF